MPSDMGRLLFRSPRMAEQAQAVRGALANLAGPASADQVAAAFASAPPERVAELLETLVTLGQARGTEGGYTSG
jgi:ActR/RegA family two-component response regulator